MTRYAALALALVFAPALAKEVKTTFGVSCVVVPSNANVRVVAIVTTQSCGSNCTLKTTTY